VPFQATRHGHGPLRLDAVLAAAREVASGEASGIDLVLTPSYHVFDGRYANNGWLQELPHPVTTHVWGNPALLSPAAAARVGCREGDEVEIDVSGRKVRLPVLVEPSMADHVVAVDLGYGRTNGGSVGTLVGVDSGVLRSRAGGLSPWLYTGASISRGRGKGRVVRAQISESMHDRPLALEGTLSEYRQDPHFVEHAVHAPETPSPGGWKYETGQKWGMVIDLSLCIGCNACVTACSAENNVPVVGPVEVSRGREMHWIRVDRYYEGSPGAMRIVRQPMLCQQCDNAPCENVCPVAATVHSADGLNEMTYNRCVGTRYCANNCPYKVRRFNYFDYHRELASPAELAMNPEVTVRSRGVMEKCTFCVQRIREAQRAARRERRDVFDGEAGTACQRACPTGAIRFGDVNNTDSRVHRLVRSNRAYRLLAELGTGPAVSYLARIRHPHPDLT
jgi:Fe-S-cluster-containing dehydrogenase component